MDFLPLGCPVLPFMETVGSSVGSRVGCPWIFCQANKDAHYIYGYRGQMSGQLSGKPSIFKYGNSEQFSGKPTELPIIKFEMEVIFV